MKLSLQGGSGSVEVSDANFDVEFNEALVHQVVTAFRNKARRGTKSQKNRAAVSGGGAKPWRQKGTGRARAGTTRGPIWVGGGRAFAAGNRSYEQKVNRRMYRLAMRSILSELVRQERLVVVDDLSVKQPKTRELASQLKQLDVEGGLLVVDQYDDNLCLAARNIPNVDVLDLREVNPYSLIRFPKVVATTAAIKALESQLS